MNREDIIRMAQESHGPLTGTWWDMDVASLERFAALVASAERKKCAEVIKDNWIYTANPSEMVYYILERGQA